MKRLFLFVLCMALSACIVGCNDAEVDQSTDSEPTKVEASQPKEPYAAEYQFFTISGYDNVGYCARIVNPNPDLWIKKLTPHVAIVGNGEAVSNDFTDDEIFALGPNEDVWISGLIPVEDDFIPETMNVDFYMDEDCWSESSLSSEDFTYEFNNLEKSVNRAARFMVEGELIPTSDWRVVDGVRIELVMLDQHGTEVGGYTTDISDCVFNAFEPIPFSFEFPQGIKYSDLTITATPYDVYNNEITPL